MKRPECPSCGKRLPKTFAARILEQDRRDGWLLTVYESSCPCGAIIQWSTKESPG